MSSEYEDSAPSQAAEARRQRVLAKLADNPALRFAVCLMNKTVFNFCNENAIECIRSRPYRKND